MHHGPRVSTPLLEIRKGSGESGLLKTRGISFRLGADVRDRRVPQILILCCLLFADPVLLLRAASRMSSPESGFVSSQPARGWEQALISGNGTMGALVFGQPLEETIILNHARLFMPLHPPLPPPKTGSHLGEIRELMVGGEYQRAADLVVNVSHSEGYGGKRWTDPFIPAFDLNIKMVGEGAESNYARAVDFQTGLTTVRWEDSRGLFQRRLFVSRADNVVVVSIVAPRAGQLNCDLQLTPRPFAGQGGWWPEQAYTNGIKSAAAEADAGWLTYRSEFRHPWPGSLQGYEGIARVVPRGGRMVNNAGRIHVAEADALLVMLRLVVLPNFKQSQIPETRRSLMALSPDFDRLLARHVKVHGELFNRVRLDLGGAADRGLTSEELIAASKVGGTSPALLEKEFDAARYAVISSSGELYPNLQGIWNGTWSPPWSSDFTQNGNVQSAIAADLDGNLAECLLPYLRYVESQVPQYRENARQLYNCRGIHLPSRTSTHGLNNHFDGTWPMTFWTAGAGWAAHFFYDYYLHTGDREFLREHALPFMKEAALFYEDFLVTGPDGKYVFSPSYSPENHPANNPSQACINATMDVSVAKELLRNCIAACQTLDTDAAKVRQWQAMLARMPDYQINADGALKEWTTPLLEDNYAHRHASHLYALFDGLPEEIATNAPVRKAFHVAIEKRMEYRRHEPNGEMAFGAVQLGLAAASLGEAETCREVVDWLANLYWTPALTSTHNAHSIFNTDICGGLPAVVIKMLVASEPGRIDLLPALPAAWPKGKIEGIRCRGQVTVKELAWDGTRVSVSLNSANRQTVQLHLPGGIQTVKVVRGKADIAGATTSSSQCSVNLPAGQDVMLQIQRAASTVLMGSQAGGL